MTVPVAMKFIELADDPDSGPREYVKVMSADSSLSSRLLSLANSPSFGIRDKVTNLLTAINLLGLSTVRTLATSYCLAGLHNDLDLSPEESKHFWEASLFRAVAGRYLVASVDENLEDEAFTAGLLQDFAMPIMYAAAKPVVSQWLQDDTLDCQGLLRREREVFGLDHTELGCLLAQKMNLAEFYVDVIAFHHSHARLGESMAAGPLTESLRLASLLPHRLGSWCASDSQQVQDLLRGSRFPVKDATKALEAIQAQFKQLCDYFMPPGQPEASVETVLKAASQAVADCTTRLVSTSHELMQQAIQAGTQVDEIMREHSRLEEAVYRDPLTGALNRKGLHVRAEPFLRRARHYRRGFAIVYLDVDNFKTINDTLGHDYGDAALKAVVSRLRGHVRDSDLVARMGGDEFVVLLNDCSQENGENAVERLLRLVMGQSSELEGRDPQATLSIGLLWVRPGKRELNLDALITQADQLMYTAKRAGGNQICRHTHVEPDHEPQGRAEPPSQPTPSQAGAVSAAPTPKASVAAADLSGAPLSRMALPPGILATTAPRPA